MNYNISGIDMMILELFTMFDTAKVLGNVVISKKFLRTRKIMVMT